MRYRAGSSRVVREARAGLQAPRRPTGPSLRKKRNTITYTFILPTKRFQSGPVHTGRAKQPFSLLFIPKICCVARAKTIVICQQALSNVARTTQQTSGWKGLVSLDSFCLLCERPNAQPYILLSLLVFCKKRPV